MTQAPDFPRAFRLMLRGRTVAELEEEFAFHMEMKTAELVARGWEPAAARAEAQRLFGDLEDARTYCRRADARREKRTMRTELFTELRQDVAYAWRTLRRSPAFTVVAILTLALGIGANTAIFSVVRGILLRPLPFQDPSRVMALAASYDGGPKTPYGSPANLVDWRDRNTTFSSVAIYGGHRAVLTGVGDAERLNGSDVTADFFTTLGTRALRGRLNFTQEEAAFQGPKTVLLDESLWRSRFGGDTATVGSLITLDNEAYRVVGIVPTAAAWPPGSKIWFPLTFDPARLPKSRGAVYLSALGRLKPGATVESAASDMTNVMAQLEKEYPDMNARMRAHVVPMQEWITGDMRRPLLILLGGVAFVLLIACANVANLLLVRSGARAGEFAVRTALGAGHGRILRQLITESLVLSVVGGAAGLVLAVVGTRLLVRAAPPSIPRLDAIAVDGLVLTFTMAVVLASGVLFGLIPARHAARPDLANTLREGSRGSGGRAGRERARRALIVAEVALSVMLLAGAGLLIRSFDRLMKVDPGFRPEHAVSFALSLPNAKYKTPAQQVAVVAALMERIRAVSGVQSAGVAMGLPLTAFMFGFDFTITGAPATRPEDQPSAQLRAATPDYFTVLGIPIVKGRGFNASDRLNGAGVMLITEAAARKFFPGQDPIGRHVDFGTTGPNGQLQGDIVGVVGDVKQLSLSRATLPQFYAPYDQWPVQSFNVVMRTTRDPMAVVADARRSVRELDPDLAVTQPKTLDAVVSESVAQPRFYMVLLAVFAAIAVLLSAIGIYGVIAYLVGQRSREIGIRIALGASSSRVVQMMVREGIAMAALGVGLGLAGALALTRLMQNLLFGGITPSDPLTYVAVTAILVAVAFVASSVPALRAARVDPAMAMRAD